ncbi:Nickel/cobalt efflux system RcnA [Maioricimonas rarisocia]|uniref:Nickel/cobalt efflux system RcnA n=1 Tax=Maioricimonas rarisocia TaxID=2528026 RepID=A0A517Z983_9PLAN|nr:sulfite exporter TauE/SafE family protein [Maioricimonas rarisocia]QDU39001.1 Nickel/cobalt efflux system RcnA [Maioricimonas rarisocia]
MHSHEITVGLSFLLGALPALEPGHGKSAMFIYLLGNRRATWHAILMGLTTAATHSVSLLGVAALVHLAHHVLTGDHHHEHYVSQVLQWVSAVLVLLVGAVMFVRAGRATGSSCSCGHHRQAHHPNCQHGGDARAEGVPASNEATRPGGYRTTALLGLAVGLLPCPSALAAYFGGLSAGHPATAYLIVLLFGAGMAISLSTVGIALQHFGARASRLMQSSSGIPWGYVRAVLILGIGLFHVTRLVFDGGTA